MTPRRTDLSELTAVLAHISDPQLIKDFLESLLTPKETADLASRWELVKMLNQGFSQRSIARELGLSLCKITRGSRELQKQDSPFLKVLRLSQEISKTV